MNRTIINSRVETLLVINHLILCEKREIFYYFFLKKGKYSTTKIYIKKEAFL